MKPRCQGKTLEGTPCRRNAQEGSEHCFQHAPETRRVPSNIPDNDEDNVDVDKTEPETPLKSWSGDERAGAQGGPTPPPRVAVHSVGSESPGTIHDSISVLQKIADGATEGSVAKIADDMGNTTSMSGPAMTGRNILLSLKANFLKMGTSKGKGKTAEAPGTRPTHGWSDRSRVTVKHILELCRLVQALEQSVSLSALATQVAGPAYIIGDLHGNYHDLEFFEMRCWPFGPNAAPCRQVFLGDYVDRGPHSVEVVLHLFALRLAAPDKFVLLRGNHEDPTINCREQYRQRSFQHKCIEYVQEEAEGMRLWEAFNETFAYLPLAAVVTEGANRVFCCHGGVPRTMGASQDILRDISGVRLPLRVSSDASQPSPLDTNSLVLDLLWADPVRDTDATEVGALGTLGFPPEFGPNVRSNSQPSLREDNTFSTSTFSTAAAERFLQMVQCNALVRAHEFRSMGFSLQGRGRIYTVFSSSSYNGHKNEACILLLSDSHIHVLLTDFQSTSVMKN